MSSSSQEHSLGLSAIFVTAILWGTIGVVASFATDVSSTAMGAASMGLSGLLQALLAGTSLRRYAKALVRQWTFILPGAIAVALYPMAFYGSMHLAGIAVGTVISMGSAPLFSAVIDRLMEGMRLTKRWAASALLGVIGIAALSLAESIGHGHHNDAPAPLTGIAIGLIAGISYAFYSWAARRVMHQHIPSRTAMGAIFGVGGLLLMPILLATGESFLHSWRNLGIGAYVVLIPMFIGYVLFGYGLRRVPASTATTITLLEPTVAAILAVIIVGERLPIMEWGGIALIMASLVCITWPQKSSR